MDVIGVAKFGKEWLARKNDAKKFVAVKIHKNESSDIREVGNFLILIFTW